MTTLRECPFCGSEAKRYEYDSHDSSRWYYGVMCSNDACLIREMRAEEDTQEAADAAWNRRSDDRYTITEAGRKALEGKGG